MNYSYQKPEPKSIVAGEKSEVIIFTSNLALWGINLPEIKTESEQENQNTNQEINEINKEIVMEKLDSKIKKKQNKETTQQTQPLYYHSNIYLKKEKLLEKKIEMDMKEQEKYINTVNKGYNLCKIEIEYNNNKDFHKFKKEIYELTLKKRSKNSIEFKELNDFIENCKEVINKEKETSNKKKKKKKTGIESKEQGRFENDLKKERETIKNNKSKLETFLNLMKNEEDIYKIKFNIFGNEKMNNGTQNIYKEDEIEIFENIQNNSSNDQKTLNIDQRIEKVFEKHYPLINLTPTHANKNI
ncbi:hypothetical protein M0813_19295 [Anaeramoeba flamelloides]|uniref:Uncharacterized protein n=1 Tax=Anaeramoeba flamelloides TaxID=1746091 RepID=A0ABQ8YPY4_9EUKA|nr:hypothetical protein M0813_19295 [Anaeramoeba flamelloides]